MSAHGAQPTEALSAPSAYPVAWRAIRSPAFWVVLPTLHRTWFAARAEAMRMLRCEPGDIEVREEWA